MNRRIFANIAALAGVAGLALALERAPRRRRNSARPN